MTAVSTDVANHMDAAALVGDGGRVWTVQAVQGLGTTTDVETAGAILGIGRSKAYELAKADEFPVRLVRIGRRYVVPVAGILRLLDVE